MGSNNAFFFNSIATPSRPVVTVMYVIGILAYASGYVLMGLTGNTLNKIRPYPGGGRGGGIFIALGFSVIFIIHIQNAIVSTSSAENRLQLVLPVFLGWDF